MLTARRLVVSLCLASSLLTACPALAAGFSAGAGRSDIVLPVSLFPIDGFTGQHDPLAVRVLLMDDGARRAALVVVDQTSLGEANITAMKAIVTEAAGVTPENIIVCASHGFSAPHAMLPPSAPPELKDKVATLTAAVNAAVRAAAGDAKSRLQPARVGFATGTSHVAVNRDVPTPFGWWLGGNDQGFTDPTLGLLRVDGADGQPIAEVMDYGVQSSVLDFSVDKAGQRLVSSDLAGVATRALEARDPGRVALFVVGAAADQAPYLQANRHVVGADGTATRLDIHDAGFDLLTLLGERLGQDAAKAAEAAVATATPDLEVVRQTIDLPTQTGVTVGPPPKGPVRRVDLQGGPATAVPVVFMRVGDVVIVGVREELSASTGAWIRAHSPFAHTMVVTMADGAAKYMPEAGAYDRFTYEARSSHYARGAAETFAQGVIERLNGLHASAPKP